MAVDSRVYNEAWQVNQEICVYCHSSTVLLPSTLPLQLPLRAWQFKKLIKKYEFERYYITCIASQFYSRSLTHEYLSA